MGQFNRPPGPKGHFMWGNMREFNHDTLSYLEQLAAGDYGDLVFLRFGPFPLYFVNHPDLVRDVLVTKADKFYKSRVTKRVLNDLIGLNVFTGDGDFWRQERRLMQPAFHTKRIGAYADVMVDYTQRMLNQWSDNAVLSFDEEMTHLTMNIVVKTLFDADIGDDTDALGSAMAVMFDTVDHRLQRLLPTPSWLPTAENHRLRRATKQVRRAIGEIIAQRRRTGVDHGDLLSMLLLAEDEDGGRLSDRQVMNEAQTLFGAGHETTAVTLTWTFYLLAQHPEVEARLHQELDEVLGEKSATLADLRRLTYTQMVIKEAMRLYPPAWATTREPIEAVEIGGYTIPKSATVLLAPWTLHRDSRWFDEPLAFRPERFSQENEANIPKYAYIPFGAGPRICIGNAFAMMEATLALATIAQRFHLDLVPGHVVEPMRVFTLRPKYGIRMIARLRQAMHELA